MVKFINKFEFKLEFLYYPSIFTRFGSVSDINFFINDEKYYQDTDNLEPIERTPASNNVILDYLRDLVEGHNRTNERNFDLKGSPSEQRAKAVVDYFNWQIDNNSSRLYTETHNVVLGLGFNYQSEKWVVNISCFIISVWADRKFQEAIQLYKDAFLPKESLINNGLNENSILPVPVLNFHRKYTKEIVEYQIGLTFGFFTGVAGISQYNTFIYNENLKIILSVESLFYFTDSIEVPDVKEDIMQERNLPNGVEVPSNIKVKLRNNLVPTIRLSLSYSF